MSSEGGREDEKADLRRDFGKEMSKEGNLGKLLSERAIYLSYRSAQESIFHIDSIQ